MHINGSARKVIKTVSLFTSVVTMALCLYGCKENGAPKPTPSNNIQFDQDRLDEFAKEFSSSLPVLVIEVDEEKLQNRNKVISTLYVFDNEENKLTDSGATAYKHARVHHRGHSSAFYPKQPFGINLRRDDGSKYDTEGLLGLRPSSKYVLHSPYADKSLLRNYFTYNLSGEILEQKIDVRFCEVFVVKEDKEIDKSAYRGIFLLTEAIEKTDNKIDVGSFSLDDDSTDFDPLGGGYIVRRDKFREDDNYFFTKRNDPITVESPEDKLTEQGKKNIQKEIQFIEDKIAGKSGIPDEDYADYIDEQNFIDYYLLQELFKSVDGGRFSVVMYRKKGEKLKTGPVWDLDLSMGNTDYEDGESYANYKMFTRPWTYTPYRVDAQDAPKSKEAPWISNLIQNEGFRQKLIARWQELRKDVLSDEHMLSIIEAGADEIETPALRNATRWPELYDKNKYIWPNPRRVSSWNEEVVNMKRWLKNRAAWLDKNIPLLDDYI